jgi:hypothetical protein
MSRKLRICRKLLSHALAALLGHLLWTHSDAAARALSMAIDGFVVFVLGQLEWYMTARPGGVKLHIQLCQLLGKAGQLYTMLWVRLIVVTITMDKLKTCIGIIALIIPLLGVGTNLCCAASRVVTIISLPAGVAYLFMTLIYKSQLYMVQFLWQALRGTKRLPGWYWIKIMTGELCSTEHLEFLATDHQQGAVSREHAYDYGSIHLVIASLLFVPCLLTFPTIAWFYGGASILHFSFLLVASALRGLARLPSGNDCFPRAKRDLFNSWTSVLVRNGLDFFRGKAIWLQ